jgi:hypothetical protein
MKNTIAATFIVVGAIVIAIPIAILGLIRVIWEVGISLATPRAPIVAERMRQLAEAAEAHISGHIQVDKQAKADQPK